MSLPFRAVGLVFQPPAPGTQKAIELFAKFEKSVSILLHRNAGAKFLDAFTFGIVHASGSIAASGR
jgi:hypothetical protein